MKRLGRNFFIILTVVLFLLGCSVKEQPKVEHEKKSPTKVLETSTEKLEPENSSQNYQQNYESLWTEYLSMIDAGDTQYLDSKKSARIFIMNEMLTRWIFSPDEGVAQKIVEDYMGLISNQRCWVSKGSCPLIRISNHIKNFSNLFLALAKKQEDILKKIPAIKNGH